MKKIVIILLILGIQISCTKSEDDSNQNPSELRIRLSNISAFDFENIKVNTSTGDVSFENLNAGEFSEYQVFTLAYRYAKVQIDIEGVTNLLQPFDYYGEVPLEKADYTYQIDAVNGQGLYKELVLTLIND